jgi:hypothetical protein
MNDRMPQAQTRPPMWQGLIMNYLLLRGLSAAPSPQLPKRTCGVPMIARSTWRATSSSPSVHRGGQMGRVSRLHCLQVGVTFVVGWWVAETSRRANSVLGAVPPRSALALPGPVGHQPPGGRGPARFGSSNTARPPGGGEPRARGPIFFDKTYLAHTCPRTRRPVSDIPAAIVLLLYVVLRLACVWYEWTQRQAAS